MAEWIVQPQQQIPVSKEIEAQHCCKVRHRPAKPGKVMQILEQQQGNQGCPNLNTQYIFAGTDKGFHLQMLLECLEKDVDLSKVFVDGGNGPGAKLSMVGQKSDLPLVPLVPDNHATEKMQTTLCCSGSDKPDDLVYKNGTMLWNDPLFNDLVRQHCPSGG